MADFSAIEAKVIAWLADEKWRAEVFKNGGDIYCASASQMFHVPVEKHGVNGHLRQKGKIAELALGYGGSVGALKAMGALEMGLSEDELQPLVDSWRTANPNIVRLWWDVDSCIKQTVKERSAAETHGIKFSYQSGMLFIHLPRGRRLCYVRPRIGENRFGGESVTYEGTGSTKKWERLESYGPKFVENIVQAIARDILFYAMTTLSHCFMVATVHDEIIMEADRRVRRQGNHGTGIAARDEFQRLLADCEDGKIDIVLCKSISRFARKTVDLLNTVRHLKDLGIEVRFEKGNINSLSGDGELMLSILAGFAQEESRSISENVKWGTRKRFEQGLPNGHFHIYGYRWEDDRLVIEPQEAEIVKLIYDNFLNGLSAESTEKQLEEMGVRSYKGMHFGNSSIRHILSNITYTGNLLFQKEYFSDPITGKSKINRGELPQYFAENTHEAIIPMETFQAVQNERKQRRELGALANWSIPTSCFTSRIKCGICGKSYRRSGKRRRKDPNEVYYIRICRNKSDKGSKFCDSKSIPEKMLKAVCAKVLGTEEFDEQQFSDKIKEITVVGNDTLTFHFYDETVLNKQWKSTARTDWWTEERRAKWGELHKSKASNPNKRQFYGFTGLIKCGQCGENFRCRTTELKSGIQSRSWRCFRACGNISIRDDILRQMVCEVLQISDFSEEIPDSQIE